MTKAMCESTFTRLCLRAATLVAVGLSLSAAIAMAQTPSIDQPRGFTNATLKGFYSAQEAGDGDVSAGFGIVVYDGIGKTTRRLTVNAPSADGGRRILEFPGEGTYTVNDDGTGAATYVNTFADGSTSTVHFDFVITKAEVVFPPKTPTAKLATEIFAVQREAGATVSLITSLQKRVPE